MKPVIRFFLSIKTAYGIFFFFVAIMVIGSLSLPDNLAFFSGIDDTSLFKWLREAGNIGTTWWIYALIAGLALCAVNTILCAGEAVLFKLGRRNLIAKLSPQVVHLGMLFAMLGHLFTASLGTKMDVNLKKGEVQAVSENTAVTLEAVKVRNDENGYPVDWEVLLRWIENGKKSEVLSLRPVHPLDVGSYGVYSKSANAEPEASALIRVTRDPGAAWALLGGVLMSAGGVGFLYGRFSAASSSFQS